MDQLSSAQLSSQLSAAHSLQLTAKLAAQLSSAQLSSDFLEDCLEYPNKSHLIFCSGGQECQENGRPRNNPLPIPPPHESGINEIDTLKQESWRTNVPSVSTTCGFHLWLLPYYTIPYLYTIPYHTSALRHTILQGRARNHTYTMLMLYCTILQSINMSGLYGALSSPALAP